MPPLPPVRAVAALLVDYATEVCVEPGNVLFEASSRVDTPEAFFVYEEYVEKRHFRRIWRHRMVLCSMPR